MKSLLAIIVLSLTGLGSGGSIFVTGTVYDQKGQTLSGIEVLEKGSKNSVLTDVNGFYSIEINDQKSILIYSGKGYKKQIRKVGVNKVIDVTLLDAPIEIVEEDVESLQEIVISRARPSKKSDRSSSYFKASGAVQRNITLDYGQDWNTEEYSTIHENGFKKVLDKPLSTFSIDVDAASYSNVRRFINNGQMPPKDAVRIEEMINYFGYNYDQPKGYDPFSINTEVSSAPWNDEHMLVQVGLQGKKLAMENLPPSNIVFLLDVSGSMSAPNKLP
ncbi:MAG: hypothetical protein HKN32_09715, partial [Flavobacteriales bacterium]|nr:hypothetical protein [Flavobacteriales bacterium]